MLLDVIIMFCIDLWWFSIDPSYFGYNSVGQENPILCILAFRNLPELNFTWYFLGINILSWEPSGAQEVNEGGHEAQKSTCGMGPRLGHATHARLYLRPLIPSIFVSNFLAWPKNNYIKTHQGVPSRRRRRNTKQRNRVCSSEDWSEKHYRSRHRSLLQPLRHHHHHGEGVVHLWTMGL
jgi:hypothetical protein